MWMSIDIEKSHELSFFGTIVEAGGWFGEDDYVYRKKNEKAARRAAGLFGKTMHPSLAARRGCEALVLFRIQNTCLSSAKNDFHDFFNFSLKIIRFSSWNKGK